MLTTTSTTTHYFLPEDGDTAKTQFLELLHSPGETWISAYAFTLQEMIDELLAADAAGVKIHLLLDKTQAAGHAEAPKLKRLSEQLKNGDLTVTTAGPGSKSASQIHHEKAMVVEAAPGEPWCWNGSVNFSASGWLQGNTASLFRSRPWAELFVHQFDLHREWAREHLKKSQLG